MKITPALTALLATAALSACDEASDEQTTLLGTTAIYSPTTGEIPLPNDLLFSGSNDGTLNVPPADDPSAQGPVDALNSLDGWSTGAPISVAFSAALDPTTIQPGTTVRFFEVTRLSNPTLPVGGPVTGVIGELVGTTLDPLTGAPLDPAANYLATPSPDGSSVVVLPLRPLDPATSYMVNLTNGILDTDGAPVTRSIVYQIAAVTPAEGTEESATLDGLRAVVTAMHNAAAGEGIDVDTIVVSQQFTTQSVAPVLGTVAAIAAGGETQVITDLCAQNPALDCTDMAPSPFSLAAAGTTWVNVGDTGSLAGSPANLADVFQGSLALPYYLTGATPSGAGASDLSNDPAPLGIPWQARYPFGFDLVDDDDDPLTDPIEVPARNLTFLNPLPEATEQEIVPVLISVPKTPKPPAGWPVVVFQHGITANRTAVLGIADALAAAGFACVSMDLPLHGLDPTSPLFVGYQNDATAARERTFGLDLADNATSAAGPDGIADASGTHFINLTTLTLSRDNVRQGAVDLLGLFSVLDAIDFDGAAGADFDAAGPHFVGHSLGGIVGTVALTQLPQVASATLGMPGGQLAYLLANSESFGPVIEAGLAGASGLTPGTPEFAAFEAQFLFAAQSVADSADPLNHAAALTAVGTPIHLIEVIGETGFSDPDQVIPNAVATAPLAGTEPLIRALQLASITADIGVGGDIRGAVRFIRGDHSSLLLPTDSAAAFSEMQAQTVEFASTDGTALTLGDESVILTN